MLGVATSEIEVSLASNRGFWLLLKDEELFVPYSEFPWFKQATLEQVTTVEWQTPNHLYWPLLDVDLAVESIRNPGRFPLIAKRAEGAPRSKRRVRPTHPASSSDYHTFGLNPAGLPTSTLSPFWQSTYSPWPWA